MLRYALTIPHLLRYALWANLSLWKLAATGSEECAKEVRLAVLAFSRLCTSRCRAKGACIYTGGWCNIISATRYQKNESLWRQSLTRADYLSGNLRAYESIESGPGLRALTFQTLDYRPWGLTYLCCSSTHFPNASRGYRLCRR